MIRSKNILIGFFFLLRIIISCHAVGFLNGTSTPVYSAINQVFHSGATSGAQGFVMLDGGFTALPAAQAVFDIFEPVSGPIDLRDTGILTLVDDLNLGANVTFSSGGLIDGRGHQLILGGNLTLPSNKILHFRSNTTIDGRGHTLTVGDYAQLFVDSAITLTLENIVLKSGAKTNVFPPVRCASSGSQLVLDNVVFEPGADIPFYQGSMSIYNTVLFTGTSALIYSSPQQSMIKSGAVLVFDKSTTFSYIPASTSKDLIQMQDATSRLVFDGCNVKCTDTGFRLTNGQLLCDNKINLDSLSSVSLSSVITLTSGIYKKYTNAFSGMRACWGPDGVFFTVSGDGGVSARVYRVYGIGGLLGTTDYLLSGNTYPYTVAWSQDRRYTALGAYSGGTPNGSLSIYPFNGNTFASVINVGYGNSISSLEWSPDARYLACGTFSSGGSYIRSFNGVSTALVGSVVAYTNSIRSVRWHPSGNYIAVAGESGLFVYSFNGSSTPVQVATKSWSVTVYDCAWSPDGQYLAVGGATPNVVDGNILAADNIRVYSFNSVTGVLVPVIGRKYGTAVYSIGWHPDGKTLVVSGNGAASGGTNNPFNDTNPVRFYKFTGSLLERLFSYALASPLSNITTMWSSYWDPRGNYVCLAGIANDYTEYYGVLQASFVPQQNSQALSNSLNFGNSANNSYSTVTTVTSGIYYKHNTAPFSMRICWNQSSSNYFAVTGQGGTSARVYKLVGTNNLLGTTAATLPYSSSLVDSLAWSPDGNYIIEGGWDGSNGVFRNYNGVTYAYNGGYSYSGKASTALAWSPNSQYIAVGTDSSGGWRILLFGSPNTYTQKTGENLSGTIYSIKWHPSGNYVAVVGDFGVNTYSFNGTTLTPIVTKAWGAAVYDVAWSPDGNYLAAVGASPTTADSPILATDNIRVYSVTNGVLTAVSGRYYGATAYGVAWHSSDNQTLAVVGSSPAALGKNNPFNDTNNVRLYQFNGSVLNGLVSYAPPSPLNAVTVMWGCAWDPTGTYLGIVGYDSSYYEYYGILQPIIQGSANNLNVKILSGARVDVRGQVVDDPV